MSRTAYDHQRQNSPNRLGRYQIEAQIGQGAVAGVYQAREENGRVVALKVLSRMAGSQPSIRRGFQREYRTLARLSHRGVIRVYDMGEVNGLFYMAIELLEGDTLEAFLARNKAIGEAAAINIAKQVAEALDYLHAQGFVHRDVKSSNIMITPNGRAILFDFGTVYEMSDPMPNEQGIYGTPAFLAPEQIVVETDPDKAPEIDGRADLYALGIVLYLMVAGRKPFYGSRSEVLDAHLHQPPPKPSKFRWVSPALEAVILKMLAKDPNNRYRTGAEIIDALEQVELTPEPPKLEIPQRIFSWLKGTVGAG